VKKGIFITFEGIDACGKSTQINLLESFLQSLGFTTLCLRDPGATAISEKIRAILLDKKHDEMSSWTELLLYEAARAQMVEQFIIPALNQGTIVLSDRFFDSTTAYQGYGRGLDLNIVDKANEIGSCGLTPDFTIMIDIDPKLAAARKQKIGNALDRLELAGLSFQQQVRNGFLTMAKNDNRFAVINGQNSIENVQEAIRKNVRRRFHSLMESLYEK